MSAKHSQIHPRVFFCPPQNAGLAESPSVRGERNAQPFSAPAVIRKRRYAGVTSAAELQESDGDPTPLRVSLHTPEEQMLLTGMKGLGTGDFAPTRPIFFSYSSKQMLLT